MFTSWFFWVVLVVSLAVVANAGWALAGQFRDRFVVTNQKVYRVHGNLNQLRASMPLTRILDITVDRPVLGRVLGYGHFVFESAAQDQGLREIKWVSEIDERERLIQRVIQAGLGRAHHDRRDGGRRDVTSVNASRSRSTRSRRRPGCGTSAGTRRPGCVPSPR